MAETIDELLVRFGLETDARSFREGQGQVAGIGTSAKKMSRITGAVLGAARVQATTHDGGLTKTTASARARGDPHGIRCVGLCTEHVIV